jgi:uncharacterized low-complexity protein
MSKKTNIIKPLSVALGATFAATLAASNVAQAAPAAGANPFAMTDLGSGYMQVADSHKEGKCGEGKKGESEGKCGEGKAKGTEGKCGEGKCGEGMKKKKDEEGKCGAK